MEGELMNWDWTLIIPVTILLAFISSIFFIGKWYGEVNIDRKRFGEFLDEIRKDIKNILGRLPPSPTSSPIQLTDIGVRISTNIDAKSWAETTAKEMVKQTECMDSLQIQEESFKRAKSFEPSESLEQKMRDSAFQEGINLDRVRDVLGVVLSGRLLKLHGKNPDSIDL